MDDGSDPRKLSFKLIPIKKEEKITENEKAIKKNLPKNRLNKIITKGITGMRYAALWASNAKATPYNNKPIRQKLKSFFFCSFHKIFFTAFLFFLINIINTVSISVNAMKPQTPMVHRNNPLLHVASNESA